MGRLRERPTLSQTLILKSYRLVERLVLYLHFLQLLMHICAQRLELLLDSHMLQIKILLVRLDSLFQLLDRALTNLQQFIEPANSFLTVYQALKDVNTALLVHCTAALNRVDFSLELHALLTEAIVDLLKHLGFDLCESTAILK